jgi:hypothetical protein
MTADSFTCAGPGPAHPAAPDQGELLTEPWRSEISIRSCTVCGQMYRYSASELNDWGPGGDRTDYTTTWTPLHPTEADLLRADLNYIPRAPLLHRTDTGWI